MKLILFSYHIGIEAAERMETLLEKDLNNSTVAFIPTAANGEKGDKSWLMESRKELLNLGFTVTDVCLEDFIARKEELLSTLSRYDSIYISGGNTFFLLYYMMKSGFDLILPELLNRDILYMGASAGSIIFNPDMTPIAFVDDPKQAPEQYAEGLDLLDFVVIPHWNSEAYGLYMKKVAEYYEEKEIKTYHIGDNEALIVTDSEVELVS